TMPYPHTGDAIREFLMCKVQEFNLQNKIFCVVTDNGSNMHEQISRIQSLVKFFDSPKQSQRLDTAQIEVSKKKTKEISDNSSDESEDHSNSEDEHNETTDNNKANINKFTPTLRNIKDIPTPTLPLQGEDARKDSIKLQKLMLQENEWELVQ
ncbi:10588_t:CDS:2, partial [Cetraspora pellucida]